MTPPAKKKDDAASSSEAKPDGTSAEVPEAPAGAASEVTQDVTLEEKAPDPVKATYVDVSTPAVEPDDVMSDEDKAELEAARAKAAEMTEVGQITPEAMLARLDYVAGGETEAPEPEPEPEPTPEPDIHSAPVGVQHQAGQIVGTQIAWNGKRYPIGQVPELATREDIDAALAWIATQATPRRFLPQIERAADKLGLKIDTKHFVR